MRKKVQLQVQSADTQIWFILDDTGVLLSGPGVEMVQAFCHLAGQGTYTLSKSQLNKYDVKWQGTLRLLRQQSEYHNGKQESVAAAARRQRIKRLQAREEPVCSEVDTGFFD